MKKSVSHCVDQIKGNIPEIPDTAIILGSGLGAMADHLEDPVFIDYTALDGWPSSTAPGHAGRLVTGKLHGRPVMVMQGRIHYYEGYPIQQVVYPVRVLGKLGIKELVITNASGGINLCYRPGDLVLVQDHINFMGVNPLIGPNEKEWGERFPDMSYAYDEKLGSRMEEAALMNGISLQRGIYIAFPGPSYETPAEIRMARTLGADLVGMSTVPEVIAANHMGIKVCAVSCVANYAAGMTSERLSEAEVLTEMGKASDRLVKLLESFVSLNVKQ